jgi:hypothetical protein
MYLKHGNWGFLEGPLLLRKNAMSRKRLFLKLEV